MLGPEEIDDDYFTPLPNTSLKNIFGSSPEVTPAEGNPLKYSPPKAENVNVNRAVAKPLTCVFACALVAHEWIENTYKSKGKLGFAIVRISKNNTHSIILYDTNKTTISSTTITPHLKVFLKGNLYLSFYDNNQKYWYLLGKDNEISEITTQLKEFDVQVVSDCGPCTSVQTKDPDVPAHESTADPSGTVTELKGSDTDSSFTPTTKKTAILNRMANMGQSMLPRQANIDIKKKQEVESSSSDGDLTLSETDENKFHRVAKHATPKTVKRINMNKDVSLAETRMLQPTPLYPVYGAQLVPSVSNTGSELNYFGSEQRICNTELRININKTSDKVDQVLDILKNSPSHANISDSNFQMEIMTKLLNEYESKLKIYEEKLQKQSITDSVDSNLAQQLEEYKNKMKMYEDKIQAFGNEHIEICNKYKTTIQNLEGQLKVGQSRNIASSRKDDIVEYTEPCSSSKCDDVTCNNLEMQELKNNITQLQERVVLKDTIINELQRQIEETKRDLLERQVKTETTFNAEVTKLNDIISFKDMQIADFEGKLKKIMNETFQLISVNFENGKLYSAEHIKAVIAVVIKKSTNDSITYHSNNS